MIFFIVYKYIVLPFILCAKELFNLKCTFLSLLEPSEYWCPVCRKYLQS